MKILSGDLTQQASMVGVIMAGGSGTRFWPSSRSSKPKQFLSLATEGRSLIQATADRLEPLVGASGTLVVTAASQSKLVEEHLPEAAVLSEPSARNTAACVVYSAAAVEAIVGDVPMLVVPADHFIQDDEGFQATLRDAAEIAVAEDVMVTIGIAPTAPETGYGYIQAGEKFTDNSVRVSRFVEKPDFETAKQYLTSGEYFWNGGIFVMRPSVLLAAVAEHLPSIASSVGRLKESISDGAFTKDFEDFYSQLESVSIDVGVMERASNVVMVKGDRFRWSDVGSWSAWADCLQEQGKADSEGNLTSGEVLLVDSKDCVGVANERLLALVGLKNVIVVDSGDALLVCERGRTQDVKKVVESLQARGRKELL